MTSLQTEDLELKDSPSNNIFLIEEAQASLNFDLLPKMSLVGNYNEYQKHWMQVAWKVSRYDTEFLVMLKAENGLLNHDRQSEVYSNGIREDSWGFCQMHRYWHKEVNDPRFLSDPKWQLAQCYKKWKGGTKFYGYINKYQRAKARTHFNFE